jgi:RimJ/RimL family protein N-acetyltransferase
MSPARVLRTERLVLRGWLEEDVAPFAEMNADPAVMEHFPARHTPEQSAKFMTTIAGDLERDGFGLWAVEVPGETPFAGFVGLMRVDADMPFAPTVEAGWRLRRETWGRGFASEAAAAALRFGFEQLGLDEIVAYTAAGNGRSRRVMQRLAMSHDPGEDFLHPRIAPEHPLAAHVLYRRRPGLTAMRTYVRYGT